jgi:hypothetical protein
VARGERRVVSTAHVRTVHLGQYTHEHAEEIAARLEAAGIVWWYKAPGYLSVIWEHGVRLFVDRARLDEARSIADAVLAADQPDGGDSSPGQA